MTLNPLRWTFRAQFLLGFAACAALLGFALYTEKVGGLLPCPLCIFQRIAFMALGLVFLVGGLHAPKSTGGRRGYGVQARGVQVAVGGGSVRAGHGICCAATNPHHHPAPQAPQRLQR